MLNLLTSILGILLTVLFVIGIHEFGHFIIARLVGVKVLRFSIGFGKALYRWHDKKGTEYVLAAIPLGGYVKMLDETEEPVATQEHHLAFNRQPIYKKTAIIAAGPLFNLLFAFALYWLLFVVGFTTTAPVIGQVKPHSIAAQAGLKNNQEIISINNQSTTNWTAIVIRLLSHVGEQGPIDLTTKNLTTGAQHRYSVPVANWQLNSLQPDPLDSLGIIPYSPPLSNVIGLIKANTPAAVSGLKIKDKILAINHHPVKNWQEVVAQIAAHPGEALPFLIKRDGQTYTTYVSIGYVRDWRLQKQGFLGVGPDFVWPKNLLHDNRYGPIAAVSHAWQNTWDFTYVNFLVFGKMLTGKISLQSLGGPITIFESAGSALNSGILSFMGFLAFLSISIGIINILPIPGLDGGHLLIQLIEFVIRRPLSLRVQMLFYRVGLILLFLLISQSLVNDILRL